MSTRKSAIEVVAQVLWERHISDFMGERSEGHAATIVARLEAAGLFITPDDDYAARWDADAQAIKGGVL